MKGSVTLGKEGRKWVTCSKGNKKILWIGMK
jgi:hypothetical protein